MSINNRGKVAIKAGVAYVISNVMVKAVFAFTTPIFVRMMTTAEYGTVSIFNTWSSLLFPVFSLFLGFGIGRAKLDFHDKLEEYAGSMLVLSTVASAVFVGLIIANIEPISSFFALTKLEVYLLLLYVFAKPAIAFKQAIYKYRYQFKQNIFIAWYTIVGTTVLSFVLMIYGSGDMALLRIIGLVVPTVLLSLVFWFFAIKNRTLNVNMTYWKHGFLISTPLIVHELSLHVLSQSDRVFIANYCGKSDVGLYSLAYTLGLILTVITSSISEAWLPWFHDTLFEGKRELIKKKVKPLVILGTYIGITVIILAPEIVLIYGGKKYLAAAICIAPVTLGIICRYIYTHYVNIELHLKKTKYVSMGTIIAASLNLILNLIFIPKYGYIAAAYTTFVSYLFLLLMHYGVSKYVLKFELYDDCFMFGIMLLSSIITFLIMQTYDNTLFRLTFLLLTAISFLFIYKEYLTQGFSVIKKVFKRSKLHG